MSNTMPIRSLPNATLLGLLLGEATAASLAGKSLADLFNLRSRPLTIRETGDDYRSERILDAAKELLARALSEEMQDGDLLGHFQRSGNNAVLTLHCASFVANCSRLAIRLFSSPGSRCSRFASPNPSFAPNVCDVT